MTKEDHLSIIMGESMVWARLPRNAPSPLGFLGGVAGEKTKKMRGRGKSSHGLGVRYGGLELLVWDKGGAGAASLMEELQRCRNDVKVSMFRK